MSDDLVKKFWPHLARDEQTGGGSSDIVEATYGANTGTLTSNAILLHALTAELLTVGRPDLGAPALQVSANLAGTGSLTADAMVVRAVPEQTSGTQAQASGGGADATTLGPAVGAPNNATVSTAMSDLTREEVDAKLKTVAAETDTKIARLEGKMDLVLSKLDALNVRFEDARNDAREARTMAHSDNVTTRANIWVVGLGLAFLIVAVAALFPVFFSIGAQIRDLVHSNSISDASQ